MICFKLYLLIYSDSVSENETKNKGVTVSWWTGVGSPGGQVEAVGVVVEQQQGVQVFTSCQDAMLAVAPRHRTVSETVNCQCHPGCHARLLQVTPAGQVRTDYSDVSV